MSEASSLGRRQGGIHHLGGQVREVTAFPAEVAREVALVAAEDPDVVHAQEGYYN